MGVNPPPFNQLHTSTIPTPNRHSREKPALHSIRDGNPPGDGMWGESPAPTRPHILEINPKTEETPLTPTLLITPISSERNPMPTIGVLAIQGDFAEHRAALESLGAGRARNPPAPTARRGRRPHSAGRREHNHRAAHRHLRDARQAPPAHPPRPYAHVGNLRRHDSHGRRLARPPPGTPASHGHRGQPATPLAAKLTVLKPT